MTYSLIGTCLPRKLNQSVFTLFVNPILLDQDPGQAHSARAVWASKHEYRGKKHLLTISISKGTGGDTFSLGLVNSSLDEAPPLEQGTAILTVVAQM